MSAPVRYWEDPRLQLRRVHTNGYRWATAEDLLADRIRPGSRHPRVGESAFLVTDVRGPTRARDTGRDDEMWRAFLDLEAQDDFHQFANTWGLPAQFDLVWSRNMYGASWEALSAAHADVRSAADLLEARRDTSEVIRFDAKTTTWSARVYFYAARHLLFDWSDIPDGLVGENVSRSSRVSAGDRELVAKQLAAWHLSGLLYRHTRNVLEPSDGRLQPEVHRLSDPIGAIALLMAENLEAGKALRRCELDTCRRLFYPEWRSDTKYCRASHRNSAANKRKRAKERAAQR